MEQDKICVLGLGYVGLPTASLLANSGFRVTGVDTAETVVRLVNNGGVHIEEPGLKALVSAAVKSGLLKAQVTPEEAAVFIVAVPTPVRGEDGGAQVDLSFVRQAAADIAPYLRAGNLVVLESTCPPGTTVEVVAPLLERSGLKAGADFYLACCPERVLPGHTLRELIHNHRVIGGINAVSSAKACSFYRRFVAGRLRLTTAATAEMVKLMENTYRDVNIALANEFAAICEQAGLNVWEAIELANLHPRVSLHRPGPGVGGHCIPVDPHFLIAAFTAEARLIALGRQINAARPGRIVAALKRFLEGLSSPAVTLLGLAYKGNINDTRNSPAWRIMDRLEAEGIRFKVYDPHVVCSRCQTRDQRDAFSGSDCVLVLTGHHEFKCLSPERAAGLMRTRRVFDTCGGLDRPRWEQCGFVYRLLGEGVPGRRG